jgi:hypothetical protein
MGTVDPAISTESEGSSVEGPAMSQKQVLWTVTGLTTQLRVRAHEAERLASWHNPARSGSDSQNSPADVAGDGDIQVAVGGVLLIAEDARTDSSGRGQLAPQLVAQAIAVGRARSGQLGPYAQLAVVLNRGDPRRPGELARWKTCALFCMCCNRPSGLKLGGTNRP